MGSHSGVSGERTTRSPRLFVDVARAWLQVGSQPVTLITPWLQIRVEARNVQKNETWGKAAVNQIPTILSGQ